MKNVQLNTRVFTMLIPVLFLFACEKGDLDLTTDTDITDNEQLAVRGSTPFEDYYDWTPPSGIPLNTCEYISTVSASYSCDGGFAFRIPNGVPNGKYKTDTSIYNNIPTDFQANFAISNSDGLSFDWESNYQICAVIVEGGKVARIYYPDHGVFGDTSLRAPKNLVTGQHFTIDQVIFCYSAIPLLESFTDCYESEDAWAAGLSIAGAGQGSAAMYVPFTSNSFTVDLVTTKKIVAGTANFNLNGNGEVDISFSLNHGWIFYYDPNDPNSSYNIKVQDSFDPPVGYALPDLFKHKKLAPVGALNDGITVPYNGYYSVYVNLAYVVECQ